MEQTQIEIDLIKEYQASIDSFKNDLKEKDFEQKDIELFEMIFEMGYQSGANDVAEKIKSIVNEYEATGKIRNITLAKDS
jgi:hypothetical protein